MKARRTEQPRPSEYDEANILGMGNIVNMKRMRFIVFVLVFALPGCGWAREAARPVSLREAIEMALQNNPDLRSARLRTQVARAGIEQADAALWPQVGLGVGYTASDNPVQAFMMELNQRELQFGPGVNFNRPSVTDNVNGHVIASYRIYNGGRDAAQRELARLLLDAAEQNAAAARNDLVFEVRRSYHNINKARSFLRAAEESVVSMESNAQAARDRYEAGKVLKSDVLDAEVRLAEAREGVVRTRHAVALAETVFRNVLGVGERELVTAGNAQGSVNDGQVVAAHDVERPEMAAARMAMAAAGQQMRAARSGFYPRVHAFARLDVNSGNAADYAESWLAGVAVEWDVFDGFLTRGRVSEARAQRDWAEEQLRKLELAVELEVRQATLNRDEARARLATMARAVEQAEESARILKDRYAQGLALLTQVLDAESALTSAKQRRAAAESDVWIAEAALDRAMGRSVAE